MMKDANHLQAATNHQSLGYQVTPLCTPNLDGQDCILFGRKCPHPGRAPLIRWKGRTAVTRQEVSQWWTKWPNANISALVGDGLVVVDISPRNGGRDTIVELGISPPEPVTVLTAGSSAHWHFDGRNNIASQVLGWGPGVLTEGKIAVPPPSLHPSGRHYQWEAGFGPDDMAAVPIPDWLSRCSSGAGAGLSRGGVGETEWNRDPSAPFNVRQPPAQRRPAKVERPRSVARGQVRESRANAEIYAYRSW